MRGLSIKKQLTKKAKSKTDTKSGVPLDKGGRRTQIDKNTGENMETTPQGRKMNSDAARGTVNPKLTGNVTQKGGVYTAKPYKGKMMNHGRLDNSGNFFPTTGGKNSPGYLREEKIHNKESANYMQTANKKADNLTKRAKNA
jgi:hypothetical protein